LPGELPANELNIPKAGAYYLQITDDTAGTGYTLQATLVGVADGGA